MRWDDLQFVLAVEREGGLAGAARGLGINYSTAHRRLSQIERAIGMRLFTRRRDGYHLVESARELSEVARRIEIEVLALERRVAGSDTRLNGTIRVSTSHLMGLYVLPRIFERFAVKFPGVAVEVSITDDLANLNLGDVDVVVRATASPPDHLSGIDLGPVSFAGYVRKDVVDRSKPLHAYEWIDFATKDPTAPLPRWLRMLNVDADCRYRFDSAAGLCEAACAGLGAAIVPCMVGEYRSDLTRITDVRFEPGFDLWILTHRDLRRSARIRSFMRFFRGELESFLGRIPGPRI